MHTTFAVHANLVTAVDGRAYAHPQLTGILDATNLVLAVSVGLTLRGHHADVAFADLAGVAIPVRQALHALAGSRRAHLTVRTHRGRAGAFAVGERVVVGARASVVARVPVLRTHVDILAHAASAGFASQARSAAPATAVCAAQLAVAVRNAFRPDRLVDADACLARVVRGGVVVVALGVRGAASGDAHVHTAQRRVARVGGAVVTVVAVHGVSTTCAVAANVTGRAQVAVVARERVVVKHTPHVRNAATRGAGVVVGADHRRTTLTNIVQPRLPASAEIAVLTRGAVLVFQLPDEALTGHTGGIRPGTRTAGSPAVVRTALLAVAVDELARPVDALLAARGTHDVLTGVNLLGDAHAAETLLPVVARDGVTHVARILDRRLVVRSVVRRSGRRRTFLYLTTRTCGRQEDHHQHSLHGSILLRLPTVQLHLARHHATPHFVKIRFSQLECSS